MFCWGCYFPARINVAYFWNVKGFRSSPALHFGATVRSGQYTSDTLHNPILKSSHTSPVNLYVLKVSWAQLCDGSLSVASLQQCSDVLNVFSSQLHHKTSWVLTRQFLLSIEMVSAACSFTRWTLSALSLLNRISDVWTPAHGCIRIKLKPILVPKGKSACASELLAPSNNSLGQKPWRRPSLWQSDLETHARF